MTRQTLWRLFSLAKTIEENTLSKERRVLVDKNPELLGIKAKNCLNHIKRPVPSLCSKLSYFTTF